MPGYVYARDLSIHEKYVMQWDAGRFPWVSTSTLPAGKSLPCHSHHSSNTHLIVQGEVGFRENCDTAPSSRLCHVISARATRASDQCFDVPPGLSYLGTAGPNKTAKFVEGHEVLSPTTRDRFLIRGDIVWSERREHVGPVSQEVQTRGRITKEYLERRMNRNQ